MTPSPKPSWACNLRQVVTAGLLALCLAALPACDTSGLDSWLDSVTGQTPPGQAQSGEGDAASGETDPLSQEVTHRDGTPVGWVGTIDWSQVPAKDDTLTFCGLVCPVTGQTLADAGIGVDVYHQGQKASVAADALLASDQPVAYNELVDLDLGTTGRFRMYLMLGASDTTTLGQALSDGRFALVMRNDDPIPADMRIAFGFEELGDVERYAHTTGRSMLGILVDHLGKPSYVVCKEGQDLSPLVLWQRDGYLVGVSYADMPTTDETSVSGIYYLTQAAWDAWRTLPDGDGALWGTPRLFDQYVEDLKQ